MKKIILFILFTIFINLIGKSVGAIVFPDGTNVTTSIEMNGYSLPLTDIFSYVKSLSDNSYIMSYYGFIRISDAMNIEPLIIIDYSNYTSSVNSLGLSLQYWYSYPNFYYTSLTSINFANASTSYEIHFLSPFANIEVFNFEPVLNGTIYIFSFIYTDYDLQKNYYISLDRPIVIKNIALNYLERFYIKTANGNSIIILSLVDSNGNNFQYIKSIDSSIINSIISYAQSINSELINNVPNRVTTPSDIYTPAPTVPPKMQTYVLHIGFDYELNDYFKINEIKIYDNNGELIYDFKKDIRDFSIKGKVGYIYYTDITFTIMDNTYTKRVYFYLRPDDNNIYIKVKYFKDLIVFNLNKQAQFMQIFEKANNGYVAIGFVNDIVNDITIENSQLISSKEPSLFIEFTQNVHCYSVDSSKSIGVGEELVEIPCNDTTVDFKVYEVKYPQIESSISTTTYKSLYYYNTKTKQLHILLPEPLINNTKTFNYTLFQLKYDNDNSALFIVNNSYLWKTVTDPNNSTITYDVFQTINAKGEVVNFQILFNLDVLTVLNPFKLDKKTIIYDDVFKSIHFQENPILLIQQGYFTKAYSLENIGKDSENLIIVNFRLDANRPMVEVVTQSGYNTIVQKLINYFIYIIILLAVIVFILSRNVTLTLMGVGLIMLIYSVLTFNYYALIFSMLLIIVSIKGGVSK